MKEDSFGLFGRVGRRRGGCWRKEERGGGPGEGAGEREGVEGRRRSGSKGGSERTGREVEAGRRGKACSLSERNNVERAKEGDSHREGVRVFGQQPPGVWSLSNTRDIRGLGFLWFGQWGGVRVFGFLGVCFVGFFWLFRGLGIWAVKILLLYLYNDYKLIIEFGMEVKKSVTTHVGAKAACHFEAELKGDRLVSFIGICVKGEGHCICEMSFEDIVKLRDALDTAIGFGHGRN